MTTARKGKTLEAWNRCDECGRFVALKDFERGATRYMVTPDSEFTAEDYETLCTARAASKKRKGTK